MTYRPLVGVPGAPGSVATDDSQDDASIALLGATTAAMNLYVDPVAGNDANPGTAALPFRTIAKALAAVPRVVQHSVKITLASGTYSEPIVDGQHRIVFAGSLLITGVAVVASGEPARTADVGLCSSRTIGTATAGWAVNSHYNKWVRITGGAGVGQVKKVYTNTADTLTTMIGDTFNPVPNGTSTYELVVPGAVIDGVVGSLPGYFDAGMMITTQVQTGYGAFSVAWCRVTRLAFVYGRVQCAGMGFDKGLYVARGGYFTGFVSMIKSDGTSLNIFDASYVDENAAWALAVSVDVGSRADLQALIIRGKVSLSQCHGTQLYYAGLLDGAATHGLMAEGVETPDPDHGRLINHVEMVGGTVAEFRRCCGRILDLTLNNMSGGGVVVSYGSDLQVDSIGGAGNTGVPMVISGGSRVTVLSACTVTGTGGTYKVGNRPASAAWADLTTYGPDDDGKYQTVVGTVPGGGGAIATNGVALNGIFGTNEVKCINMSVGGGTLMVEDNGAPADGHFQTTYATGVFTFHANQAGNTIRIMFSPVSYTGARIG